MRTVDAREKPGACEECWVPTKNGGWTKNGGCPRRMVGAHEEWWVPTKNGGCHASRLREHACFGRNVEKYAGNIVWEGDAPAESNVTGDESA